MKRAFFFSFGLMKMCLPACRHNVHTIIIDGTRLVDRTLSSCSLVNLPGSVELSEDTQSDDSDERRHFFTVEIYIHSV